MVSAKPKRNDSKTRIIQDFPTVRPKRRLWIDVVLVLAVVAMLIYGAYQIWFAH